MATEGKKAAASGEKKPKAVSDRKRLSYLKMRFKEAREQMASIKKEMTELKKKLGASKGAGAKAKGAGSKPADDDDDED